MWYFFAAILIRIHKHVFILSHYVYNPNCLPVLYLSANLVDIDKNVQNQAKWPVDSYKNRVWNLELSKYFLSVFYFYTLWCINISIDRLMMWSNLPNIHLPNTDRQADGCVTCESMCVSCCIIKLPLFTNLIKGDF